MNSKITVVAAFALAACSSSPGPADGGDAGQIDQEVFFNVSGTAAMVPESLGVLADAGVSTTMAGLVGRVEEPFRVATEGDLGVFSSAVMDSSGTFSASHISSLDVTLGVAGGVRDANEGNDAGLPLKVVRAATVLFDVALEGHKPTGDVSGKAWAVPTVFHDALTAAITPAVIQGLTSGNEKSTLIEAGFILGRLVDASGAPVAGATLSTTADRQSRFFYPTADFTGVGTATASNGLFVYVHNAGAVATFNFTVTGKPEYARRSAGAATDAALVITVYPGTTAP